MDLLADMCAAALDAQTHMQGCRVSVGGENAWPESPATKPTEQVASRGHEGPAAATVGRVPLPRPPQRYWRRRQKSRVSPSTVRAPAKKRKHDDSACGPVGTCLLPSSRVFGRLTGVVASCSQASAQSRSLQDSRRCSRAPVDNSSAGSKDSAVLVYQGRHDTAYQAAPGGFAHLGTDLHAWRPWHAAGILVWRN